MAPATGFDPPTPQSRANRQVRELGGSQTETASGMVTLERRDALCQRSPFASQGRQLPQLSEPLPQGRSAAEGEEDVCRDSQ
jgi:hypothetical protein